MRVYLQEVSIRNLNQAVAAELAQVRTAQGLSQTELADLAGMTRVTVQRYETGGTIKLPELEKLCLALGEDPSDFFARAARRVQREH